MDNSTLLQSAGLDISCSIVRTAVPTPTSDLISIVAAGLPDKLPDLTETETRALPNRFRREIGIERSPMRFAGHAASVVRDDNFYPGDDPGPYDDALENDLGTSTREITSRHEIDKPSLLPPPRGVMM